MSGRYSYLQKKTINLPDSRASAIQSRFNNINEKVNTSNDHGAHSGTDSNTMSGSQSHNQLQHRGKQNSTQGNYKNTKTYYAASDSRTATFGSANNRLGTKNMQY